MREHGFSLVEALIAATIVIVGISGLAQLFVIASAANQRAKSRTMATVLAQSRMEELKASRLLPAPGVDYADSRGNLLGEDASAPSGAIYVRRWSVAAMPSNASAVVLEVSVTFPRAAPGEVVRLAGIKVVETP